MDYQTIYNIQIVIIQRYIKKILKLNNLKVSNKTFFLFQEWGKSIKFIRWFKLYWNTSWSTTWMVLCKRLSTSFTSTTIAQINTTSKYDNNILSNSINNKYNSSCINGTWKSIWRNIWCIYTTISIYCIWFIFKIFRWINYDTSCIKFTINIKFMLWI